MWWWCPDTVVSGVCMGMYLTDVLLASAYVLRYMCLPSETMFVRDEQIQVQHDSFCCWVSA